MEYQTQLARVPQAREPVPLARERVLQAREPVPQARAQARREPEPVPMARARVLRARVPLARERVPMAQIPQARSLLARLYALATPSSALPHRQRFSDTPSEPD